MCQFGMVSKDKEGEGPVKKTTRLMTNAIMIRDRLGRKCKSLHRHIHLTDGRAKKAQVYPEELSVPY